MAKAGRWLRSVLTARKGKDREKHQQQQPTPSPSKEKKRWSFRRSTKEHNSTSTEAAPASHDRPAEVEIDLHGKSQAMATTLASADAAVVAPVHAEAAMAHLKTAVGNPPPSSVEEVAAVKIQAMHRAYLARKALKALKGLVKLQALIRGHLVRKQATAMLRCMQALVAAQTRARIQRIQMLENAMLNSQRQLMQRRSPSLQDPRFRQGQTMQDMGRNMEDKVKDVKMDLGDFGNSSRSRNSYPASRFERQDHRLSPCYRGPPIPHKADEFQQYSPAPSTLTDMSPRACSGHFEELSFRTTQSSPNYLSAISKLRYIKDYALLLRQEDTHSVSNSCSAFYPNYMANTESSKAKTRSQSAPRQRPDACGGVLARRRPPVDHRNTPRAVRMQRSSSHVGSSANGSRFPWNVNLDKSHVSIKDSECGSTSSLLSNTNFCRS